MTYEENVRAILESNFAGFKEEVIDTACKCICDLQSKGKWIKEWEEVPITDGIMHQPYWSCPRCGRKWEAYSAQFITFCSKCGMELIDGDCEEGDSE